MLIFLIFFSIDENIKQDMQKMFENGLDNFVKDYEPLIPSLGSLFLIAKPSFIQSMSNVSF